jgi:hypothetical protein
LTSAEAARDFPENARRGTITAHQYPQLRIGSVTYRLAAGGRIFNQDNMIIMPASLPKRRVEVMYQLDFTGQLSKIWLLTDEEAVLNPKPRPTPLPSGAAGR